MHPSSFDESNDVLDPPDGVDLEDCSVLSVWRGLTTIDQPVVISCWKPTPEELEEINRTGRVWLYVWGQTMQPSAISGHYPFTNQGDK